VPPTELHTDSQPRWGCCPAACRVGGRTSVRADSARVVVVVVVVVVVGRAGLEGCRPLLVATAELTPSWPASRATAAPSPPRRIHPIPCHCTTSIYVEFDCAPRRCVPLAAWVHA
jgi:hypothetical protein